MRRTVLLPAFLLSVLFVTGCASGLDPKLVKPMIDPLQKWVHKMAPLEENEDHREDVVKLVDKLKLVVDKAAGEETPE